MNGNTPIHGQKMTMSPNGGQTISPITHIKLVSRYCLEDVIAAIFIETDEGTRVLTQRNQLLQL